MNIIQAREAAMAGKTVVSPNGFDLVHYSFGDMEMISREWVFGEWSIKQEPVVFEAEVSSANEKLYGPGVGMIASRDMRPLIGKRVKVTVATIEDV